ALLRPGRFDRRVIVDMPDLQGRLGILKVHSKNIPLADDVDLEIIARGTPGMSGADLANTVNEAALLAAKLDKNQVEMEDLENAKDKVRLGPERKSHVMKEDARKVSAYHESGHVIVGSYVENSDPLHKVTIIPRGRAGGLTFFLPKDDMHFHSKEYLMDIITTSLGGRVSEELFIGSIGTGAQNDISRASSLARRMVAKWGMSDNLGPISFDHQDDDHIFLGKQLASRNEFSEETAREIDNEISKIINECHKRAEDILTEHTEELHKVAQALLKRESLDGEEIKILLSGGTLDDPIAGVNKSDSGDKSPSKNESNEKGDNKEDQTKKEMKENPGTSEEKAAPGTGSSTNDNKTGQDKKSEEDN
ncbi:MAG TPA: cell division protein FtsH, partial [Candidatus Krumholzibacteriaceae bacterium]|nr:cell division protein FtsH [Candidatus Krumholzibacteriaceae bacterium]